MIENGLTTVDCKVIFWTKDYLSIGSLETNFSDTFITTEFFYFQGDR